MKHLHNIFENIKNKYFILILLSFFSHLISLNFYPTNFEGAYGEGAYFIESSEKLQLINIYFISQFNTFIFPLIASLLKFLLPFLNGDNAIRIISSSSYVFLIIGIFNLYKYFFKKSIQLEFLLIIILNPIIWHYGYRMYVDLFSFSLSIFAFSNLLINQNKRLVINSLLLGLGVSLKIFNLFFFPVIFLIKYKQNHKIFKLLKLSISICIIPIAYNLIMYFLTNNLLLPKNEDLKIAFISSDPDRGLYYFINNFVNYIGYLVLLTIPFNLFIMDELKFNILKITNLLILISISFILSLYINFSAELNLGPLQAYIPDKIFFFIISFCFFIFCYSFFIILFKQINTEDIQIKRIIFILIILFLLSLSLIKGSQRYIIPALIFYLLIIEYSKINKIIINLIIVIYIIVNILLILHYHIVGESVRQIMLFLNNEKIKFQTHPNIITPHVYHLYQNKESLNNGKKIYLDENLKYKIVYYGDIDEDEIFVSNYKLFNKNIYKYKVVPIN